MSKKVNQTLTGAMAAMMATGVVATPAMAATTDVDALYKAAYTATQKALTEKTQAAVNEARAAIKALPANLDWAIGEFSKKVDSVQHPILVNIVEAIKLAEKNPTQANIDAAKKAIPADLTPVFKNSYSQAVDKIQQGLQAKVVEAVKLAETSRKAEDVEAAKKLIADVATANSQALKDWAKAMLTKVEAVKLYDLDVTKAIITKANVAVEFKALDEALRNATIEVVDNKGNLVGIEVKSVLIEGETNATFAFVSELKDRPEGVWTINGFKVNLDHVNLIEDAKNLAKETQNETNSQKLFDLLQKSGLVTGLTDSLVAHKLYHTNLAAAYTAEKVSSVADIQKIIDETNLEIGTDVKAYDIVKTANNGTLGQFKEILNKSGLKRINEDFYTDYKEKFKSEDEYVTLSDLQGLIDEVNLKVVTDLFDSQANTITTNLDKLKIEGKLSSSLISKYMVYVEEYVVLDETKDSYKQDLKDKEEKIHNLKVLLAITSVNSADTQVSLKTALKNLETVIADKDTFSYETFVNENVITNVVKANTGVATDVDGVKTLLKTGQENAIKAAIDKIAEKAKVVNSAETATASQKTDLLNAYNELVKVSQKIEKLDGSQESLDSKLINENLLVTYAKTAKDYTSSSTTVETINDNLEADNGAIIKNELAPENTSITTGDEDGTKLFNALKNIGINNLVSENKKAYLTDIKVVVDSGDENKVKDEASTGTEWTKELLQKKVDSVNSLVTILNSKDIATVKDNLTKIAVNESGLNDYLNASSLIKSDVAELLITAIANQKAGNDSVVKLSSAITKLSELKTAVTTVDGIRTTNIMEKIDVSTPNDLVLANTVSALELVSSDFAKLETVNKYAVAEAFNDARETYVSGGTTYLSKLGNFTAIRTLLATVMK